MKVIGTAGHIDHGKSALVQRLTGIDPDRLEEEKRRGMTIDLGFAWLTLPSGLVASVVDVPGHERFVKNMLAGVGGIDLVLLVIAADEGVMPQTREHVHITDLLGIGTGVVALTKRDVVDNEWLELVKEDVSSFLMSTRLASAPIVPVSAVTGDGIDELLGALDATLQRVPPRPQSSSAYLPVDRVFTVAGFGTVVTGTLHEGSIAVGQELEIVPGGTISRIRGLQTHGRSVDHAESGDRVAANLVGIARDKIGRGDVLALPGTVMATSKFDARLQVLSDAPFPITHGMQAQLHIGAAERTARVVVLEGEQIAPGETRWAQIRTDDPVPAVRGQRFIVRLPAPGRTVAGGEVVDLTPHHRRSDALAIRRLDDLTSSDFSRMIRGALSDMRPHDFKDLRNVTGLAGDHIKSTLHRLMDDGEVLTLGSQYVSSGAWKRLESRVTSMLRRYHASQPLRRGMQPEELRSRLRVPHAQWPAVRQRLVADRRMAERAGLLALPEHVGGSAGREEEARMVLRTLEAQPFSPPSGAELAAASGADAALLAAMVDEGQIVRVADSLYFGRDAYDRMVSRVVQLIRTSGPVNVGAVRDDLGTSRKYALALLEHLDDQGITRRRGDSRVLGRAATCA